MKMTLHPTSPRTALAPASCLRTAAALLLSALCLGGLAAGPAIAANEGALWTVKPAANSFGADRKDYGYTLSPAGRQEDGVEVFNQGATTLRLALRPADGVTTPAGRIGLVDRGARSKDVAAWVRLEQEVVTVDPGASVTVPFTITPPKNAAAGDHVGGIVTFLAGPTAVAAAADGADADQGHALQIRLRTSGVLKPGLSVDDLRMRYSGTANPVRAGAATVTYTIRNSGNVILTARQAVSASGPFGAWSGRAGRIADTPALLPGSTWKVSVPLRGVKPAFRQSATVTLTPLLADAAGSISPLPATTATGHAWAVPWSLLIALIVMCGLAGVALRRVGAVRRANGAVA